MLPEHREHQCLPVHHGEQDDVRAEGTLALQLWCGADPLAAPFSILPAWPFLTTSSLQLPPRHPGHGPDYSAAGLPGPVMGVDTVSCERRIALVGKRVPWDSKVMGMGAS